MKAACRTKDARAKQISDAVAACHGGVDVTPMKPLRFNRASHLKVSVSSHQPAAETLSLSPAPRR